jgi:hypothetical protein
VELGAQNYNMIGRLKGKPVALVAVYQAPGANAVPTAAGTDFHVVHDWAARLNQQSGCDTAADPNAARIAFESSPLASVKTWKSPILLIQGMTTGMWRSHKRFVWQRRCVLRGSSLRNMCFRMRFMDFSCTGVGLPRTD